MRNGSVHELRNRLLRLTNNDLQRRVKLIDITSNFATIELMEGLAARRRRCFTPASPSEYNNGVAICPLPLCAPWRAFGVVVRQDSASLSRIAGTLHADHSG